MRISVGTKPEFSPTPILLYVINLTCSILYIILDAIFIRFYFYGNETKLDIKYCNHNFRCHNAFKVFHENSKYYILNNTGKPRNWHNPNWNNLRLEHVF